MSIAIQPHRLAAAHDAARRELLAARSADGHWIGELSSSPLSTATAAGALAVVARESGGAFDELIGRGIEWLLGCQAGDGGWGDTDKSRSNIATTMLVRAAFELSGAAARHPHAMRRADAYVESEGGVEGLRRRFGDDKTFAVPILANCALSGLVPWSEVSPLPFEVACLPQATFRHLGLPVVSYAIPALVAIGQARFFHRRPKNPITRLIRHLAVPGSLATLERMQPASGGFLEAAPLTSFVVMSLAGSGRVEHDVVERGVAFLTSTVRADGSWPIDTNLATWTTTLAIGALSADEALVDDCLPWLLNCQHQKTHPFTKAAPGGWGWSDLSGAVPDADDTAGALLALSNFLELCTAKRRVDDSKQIMAAAEAGVKWLLSVQNRDGGWPTFCRGWGKLPFDRSACDLTAHALRALFVWQKMLGVSVSPYALFHSAKRCVNEKAENKKTPNKNGFLCGGETLLKDVTFDSAELDKAISRGLKYLEKTQRSDGSWVPLWFGNQHHAEEENPIYGTARVLMAYRDLDLMESTAARRGIEWLAAQVNSDGGFGGDLQDRSSVEETAVAVEALSAAGGNAGKDSQVAVEKGLRWLVQAVEQGRIGETSPIGFYFAKLWYYEKLYPLAFAVSALRPTQGDY